MIKFLPSYVGSKASYVSKLAHLKGEHFVELFAGSAILSANLAKTTILNDLDENIYRILNNFDELNVPELFTQEDYFKHRVDKDWWKYAYCFQKMSFSGVFRYSKNGYNVPVKKNIKSISIRADYLEALHRWKELKPAVFNKSYVHLDQSLFKDRIVISDPPYESSQASYNNNSLDYHLYWEYIRTIEGNCKSLILFDKYDNLPFKPSESRTMTVNGKRNQNKEGMFVFNDSLKSGQKGEELFMTLHPCMTKLSGFKSDFQFKQNEIVKTIELKSDYYDMDKTPNFFIERYSDFHRKTDGGPWQALKHSEYFVYFFPKNNKLYWFKTKELVDRLNTATIGMQLYSIPNKGWTTMGYKIPRKALEDIRVYDIEADSK